MNDIKCYTGLNRPIYFLGVPLIVLLVEGFVCFLAIMVFHVKFYFVIPVVLVIHKLLANAYKKDDRWVAHFLFRIHIPERKMYRSDVSYYVRRDYKDE